jgi:plastocyanin
MKVMLRSLAVAALLLGAACGNDDDSDGDTASAPEATDPGSDDGGIQTVEVVADDYAYPIAPDEVEAGVIEVTFENQGEVPHEAQMISIGDTPVEQFVEDFGPVLEGGPFPDYVEEVTGVGEVEPGETLTAQFTVTSGNYVWFCTFTGDAADPENEEGGDPHFMRGMIRAVTVVDGVDEPTLPETDSTITARDYGFDVDVQAGDQTVAFYNEGPEQIHHAVLFAFSEGTTEEAGLAALTTFLASEDQEAPPPPELDFESTDALNDSAVYSEGQGGTFDVTLASGRSYAVLCFLSDREGGPPHAIAHQMVETFTVE